MTPVTVRLFFQQLTCSVMFFFLINVHLRLQTAFLVSSDIKIMTLCLNLSQLCPEYSGLFSGHGVYTEWDTKFYTLNLRCWVS